MRTVIAMAEECGIPEFVNNESQAENIIRFAEFVRKDYSFTHAQMWLKRFDEAIAAEREACAKLCESLFDMDDDSCSEAETCATAIRARNNT